MYRRQTLFQAGFISPIGPDLKYLGERIDTEQLVFMENEGRFVEVRLPGFQSMPTVEIRHIVIPITDRMPRA